MSRPGIPQEQKDREAAFVRERFERMQLKEPGLTQESLAHEFGKKTQGLVNQWLTGKTPIPDNVMMYLGGRLQFDPFEVRPSLRDYLLAGYAASGRDGVIAKLVKHLTEAEDDEFRRLSKMVLAYLGDDDTQP